MKFLPALKIAVVVGGWFVWRNTLLAFVHVLLKSCHREAPILAEGPSAIFRTQNAVAWLFLDERERSLLESLVTAFKSSSSREIFGQQQASG
jgi:hypothetical protein